MEMNELMRQVLELLPNAVFGEDNETGEIVIATGLVETKAGQTVPLESK
jgi:hypothetical protein